MKCLFLIAFCLIILSCNTITNSKTIKGNELSKEVFDSSKVWSAFREFVKLEYSGKTGNLQFKDLIKIIKDSTTFDIRPEKTICSQNFDFSFFKVEESQITDSSSFFRFHINKDEQIVKVEELRNGHEYFKFLVFQKDECLIIKRIVDEHISYSNQLEFSLEESFFIKFSNDNFWLYFGVSDKNYNNVLSIHNIMLLDSRFFPIKQLKWDWLTNKMYNTEFIYTGDTTLCEIVKSKSDYKLTFDTRLEEVIRFYNMKVNVEELFVAIPGILMENRSFPHWYFGDYLYKDEFSLNLNN